ncbi:hypothetical protein GEV33_010578 [Tenebrio molitor]|uniref:Odorant receptor n=1 Tax=Tenebrio molitor TaxID=7067 RepID=A0A8J6L604_TENMO|nr:hypothetical protein GEV33_010578 [Tenebrio molitor]
MFFISKNNIGIKVDPFRHLKFCLRLWGQRDDLFTYCYLLLVLKLSTFIARTVFILRSTSDATLLEISATYPIPLLAITKLLFLLVKRRNVRFLFTTVETDFWDPSVVGQHFNKHLSRRFLLINVLLLGHCILSNLYVILHLVFPPTSQTRWLPTPISFPLDQDQTPTYELLFVILTWNMFVSVFGNAFFDFLFVYAAQHLCAQFTLLQLVLKKLQLGLLEDQDDVGKFHSESFQCEVCYRITECLKHHSLLLRFLRRTLISLLHQSRELRMDFVPEGSVGFKVDPLRHLKYCLRLWGQKRRLLVLCYFVLALKLFGFVLRTIFILKSMNNVEMLLEVSATYPIPLLAIVKLTYLLCRPSRVQFLLNPVETQFWNLSVAGARLRSYWDKRFLVINLLLVGHWLVCNGYVVLHLAFPYIPIPEGRTRWLPTLISIPFNTDATPLYEILYVILSWNMFVSVSGNGFFDFLFVYSAQHLCAQFAVLKAMLKKLDFGLLDHHNDLEKFNSQTFQREVHNRIVLCINHHNMLLRYFDHIFDFHKTGYQYPTRMNFILKEKIGIRVDPLRHLKYCLRLWGQRQKLLIFCYIIYALKLFGFVSRTIPILKSTSDLRTKLELCATYPVPLLALIKMGFLLSKHENVRFLFSCVERKFWDFSTGGRRLQKYWTKRFFVVNSLLLQHFTVACAYVILHLAFAEVPIPEGRTRWLPTLIAFPVNTDTSPVYEILYAILSWNLFISIFGNAFFDLLFVYAAQHLCAQFMLLKAMLKKVDFGLVEHHGDVVKFKSKTFQTEVYSRLVICINHHSLLLSKSAEVLDFLMGYESYLRKRRIPSFLTGLSLHLRADISKTLLKMGILLFEFCKRRNARLVFTTVETSFWHLSLPFRKLLAQEILSRQLSTPLALDNVLDGYRSWSLSLSIQIRILFMKFLFDFLFVYAAQHLCAQLMLLGVLLKKLESGLMEGCEDVEKFKSVRFQEEVRTRLATCANHHTLLLRYGRELKNLSSLIFGVQLLTTLLTLVMTGYTLSQDFEELTKSTMLLSFVFSSAMQFSIFAFQSADIHHQSSSVAEAAYQCNWYLFNAKAKRGLTLLIMNSQQGISMCGAGIVVMDNRVIVKMAQKVFSCITLLRSLEQ